MMHCYQPKDRDASTPPAGVTLTAKSSTTVTSAHNVANSAPTATMAAPGTRYSGGDAIADTFLANLVVCH